MKLTRRTGFAALLAGVIQQVIGKSVHAQDETVVGCDY
jgi:hypothetical protein